jgi:multidrug resistance efflux pump
VGLSVIASIAGHVEVNGRGRGIVRPTTGIRLLVSQTGGVAGRIEAQSGREVKMGMVLVSVNTPSVQSELLSAQRQIDAVSTYYTTTAALQNAAYDEQSLRLKNRIAQLTEQLESQRQSVGIFERRLESKLTLEKDSIMSPIEVDAAREELAQAKRQVGSAQQALDQALQERAALESRRQDELWQSKQIIQNAKVKKDALSFMQEQTEIRAPEDGVVEAMMVKPGEVVQPGQAVGKLIPRGSPLQVVSFLAEKDRAFVKVGDEARLELDQLPYAEFGTLRAKVVRISDDLASPFEIQEALGENQKLDAPCLRVELEITDGKILDAAKVKLRSGMLMNVRYTLRKQRLITLVLDPLRKWFR